MTMTLPPVDDLPPEPRYRWWWQPLWHAHPARFTLVVLLVIAGGIAWGIPAGNALRPVIFPPKPQAPVAVPTPSPSPTHKHRRKPSAVPQPTYAPRPTYRPTHRPTPSHSVSVRPSRTKKSTPPKTTPTPPCVPFPCSDSPTPKKPKSPTAKR
jgi:hypothetical protein